MGRIVSAWAEWYRLPDPAILADELFNISVDLLKAATDRADEAAKRITAAAPLLAAAAQTLQSSWSRQGPVLRVQRIGWAATMGREVIAGQTDAARPVVAAITAAQARARTLDDAAEMQATADPTPGFTAGLTDLATAIWGMSPIPPRFRSELVLDLHGQLQDLLNHLDDDLMHLTSALHEDPRDGVQKLELVPLDRRPKASSPVAADDAADRAALAVDLQSGDPFRRLFAARVQVALDAAAAGGEQVNLLLYDPDHPQRQGGAAIGLGPVAGADHVALLVPGVANSPGDMTELLAGAQQIRTDAQALAPDEHTAAVVWLGYDVPVSWPHDAAWPMPVAALQDSLRATNALDAIPGGIALAGFANQLRSMLPRSATLTAIGHSYGATVVSEAANHAMSVDDIVLLAAPGAGWDASTAHDYAAVSPDHVYSLSFDGDPVTQPTTDLLASLVSPMGFQLLGGPFGPDPAATEFGAQVIDAHSTEPDLGSLNLPRAIGGLDVTHVPNLKQHDLDNYLAGAAGLAVAGVVVSRYSSVPTRKGR